MRQDLEFSPEAVDGVVLHRHLLSVKPLPRESHRVNGTLLSLYPDLCWKKLIADGNGRYLAKEWVSVFVMAGINKEAVHKGS
jgi:hypothetical protein